MKISVRWKSSFSLVGTVLKWLSVPLLLPLFFALYERRDIAAFVLTILITLITGYLLEKLDKNPVLKIKESFLMVAMTWLFIAMIGALPYILAGRGSLAVAVNAFFESMSGFTTTGSTVLADISFEGNSLAILIWRQLSQWLGGMGIVVLAVAILPKLAVGGAQLMEAETPGPGVERLAPRIMETARRLWILYVGLTLLQIVFLYSSHLLGMAPQMTLFQAVAHAFSTLPTGGFSTEARSIAAFSPAVQWIVIVFMFLAGTNFALMWRTLTSGWRLVANDEEFTAYRRIIALLISLLVLILMLQSAYVDFFEALRHASFQLISIVTTTGYASADFNLWGGMATTLLFLAMFVGGSAGSTGGGIKIIRWAAAAKASRRELFTSLHPKAILPLRFNGQILKEKIIRQILVFIIIYFAIFLLGTALIGVIELYYELDATPLELMSAVAACIGNIGPGFGIVGPMNNFLCFSAPSRIILALLMWIGRLELFTVLVLLLPSYWKR
ncbi:MAG: TrkH family potassium uptake protein [bacterium]